MPPDFSIVQKPLVIGINPFNHLKDVPSQIPKHTNKTVVRLTPENWLKDRRIPASRAT